MSEFSISFPPDQVRSFEEALLRIERDLGKSTQDAINMGARQVLRSLAASTRVAKMYRDYQQVGETRSGKNKIYKVKTKYVTPMRKGKALRRSSQGPWRDQLIYAFSENELRQRPAVIIGMRGVAKESWLQAGKKGRINIGVPKTETAKRTAGIMKKAARRWVDYSKRFTREESYIHIANNIRHINEALAGGPKAVDTAMDRAARGMNKMVEEYLKREAAKV
jgi:hypothetical protein